MNSASKRSRASSARQARRRPVNARSPRSPRPTRSASTPPARPARARRAATAAPAHARSGIEAALRTRTASSVTTVGDQPAASRCGASRRTRCDAALESGGKCGLTISTRRNAVRRSPRGAPEPQVELLVVARRWRCRRTAAPLRARTARAIDLGQPRTSAAISSTVSHRNPVRPWSIPSGTPPRRNAISGVPHSIDSGSTTGNGSSHSIGISIAAAPPSSACFCGVVDRADVADQRRRRSAARSRRRSTPARAASGEMLPAMISRPLQPPRDGDRVMRRLCSDRGGRETRAARSPRRCRRRTGSAPARRSCRSPTSRRRRVARCRESRALTAV